MDATAIKNTITQWVDANQQDFHAIAAKIFDYAELGMQEHKSSQELMAFLSKHGFTVDAGVAGMPTAFVATWGKGKPVIGISTEYDALPGLSQGLTATRTPVKQGAPGHGCGHNLLGVGGSCAALALKQAMQQAGLEGTIKVFGTPAEELCIGKTFMARAGCFDGVDAILDWHPYFLNFIPYRTNAYTNIYYHFKGKTAHGNAPWNGRSALDAAMLMGHAAELLREHIRPGREGSENTFNYTFPNVGPEFPSVVPDTTTAWYVGRFNTAEMLEDFLERLDNCAKGAALATGTTVTSEPVCAIHEMIGNQSLARVVYDNWERIGTLRYSEEDNAFAAAILKNAGVEPQPINEDLEPFEKYNAPVTDSSEYSWFAPEATVFVSMAPRNITWHNWQTAALCGNSIGRKAAMYAGKLLACTAVDLILKPELIAAAKEEHAANMAGRVYKSMMSDDLGPPLDINKQTMEKYKG